MPNNEMWCRKPAKKIGEDTGSCNLDVAAAFSSIGIRPSSCESDGWQSLANVTPGSVSAAAACDGKDDASQPITPEWLDRCGVSKSTRGSVLAIYQVGCLGMVFKDGSLRTAICGCQLNVATRDQLRSLLEMLGEPELVEKEQSPCR